MARRRRTQAGDHAAPDRSTALDIALRYLGSRPRTRHEITQRLQRDGITGADLDATLERLADYGYVDDVAFARWWAEQRDRHAPRGRRLLEAELRRHGVPHDVIEAFREEHASPERLPEDAGLPATEAERADDVLARHLRGRPVPQDPKARQRLGAFLMRRGFDPETVRTAIRAAGADDDRE